MQSLKPSRAVAVIADGRQIGTLARRKISKFRKFLLNSGEYPEETRKEWKEHKNRVEESILLAYVHECGRVGKLVEERQAQLKPQLSILENEVRSAYAAISALEAERARLQKISQKILRKANSGSSHEASQELKELLEKIDKESERFGNVDAAIESFGQQIMKEAQEEKDKIVLQILSGFGKKIDEDFARMIERELSGLSEKIGQELTRKAIKIFMDANPDYALIEGCKNLLKDGTPFEVFALHAKMESIESDLEKLMQTQIRQQERPKVKKLCETIASCESNMRESIHIIDYFIAQAGKKRHQVEKIINGIRNHDYKIYLKSGEGELPEQKAMLILRFEEEAAALQEAVVLAKKAKKIFEAVHLQQFARMQYFVKYLEIQDQIDETEEKMKSLKEKIDCSKDYFETKSKFDSLELRLSEIKNAQMRAQLYLEKLVEKRKAEEKLRQIRLEGSDERLARYLEKIEAESLPKPQLPLSSQLYLFHKSRAPEESQKYSRLCLDFVAAARNRFKDFLNKYPHISDAFDKTLFALAEVFINSGFSLNRDRLTSIFKGRIKQQYLPNASASVVRLGMVGSNEYRFIIDITDSKRPIILMAGIKEDSKRFMKRLVQGGYLSERSKALHDGRADLFGVLSGNKEANQGS
ncbi:MAG: hypothetical protein N3G80_03715 [Candidatus Micrarchaeota archaeon]|nr:hypothetical protein [Candidatus Micrarchaeota archaeon]